MDSSILMQTSSLREAKRPSFLRWKAGKDSQSFDKPMNQIQSIAWRNSYVDHLKFLVNGELYFEAIYEQILKAESSICILAWQLDFKVQLKRDGSGGEDCSLEAVLQKRLKEVPNLEVYILVWDHPLVYAQDREMFNSLKVSLNFPSRVYFRWDPEHPFWASHHAKLVIIDGKTAYTGGLDIAVGRWDTSPHLTQNPKRIDNNIGAYTPYHDVMLEMQGPVIEPLFEYFKCRWEFSGTSVSLDSIKIPKIAPSKDSIPCHIARTAPKYKTQRPVHEIEDCYLTLIDSAQEEIYIENQYISCGRVVDHLAKKLRERSGPYVTLVLPFLANFSLEGLAMGTTVDILVDKLIKSDRYNRLAVFYPVTRDEPRKTVKVHSKLMCIDNHTVIVGSANLNERSMGLDTELDVVLSASESQKVRTHIADLKTNSLCSFTGEKYSIEDVSGAKLQSILKNSPCFRQYLLGRKPNELKIWAKENLPLDYNEPLPLEQSLELSMGAGKPGTWKRIIRNILISAILIGVALTIGFNFDNYLQPMFQKFLGFMEIQTPSPLMLVLGFGILGGIFFPVNLFIVGMGLIFTTTEAILYCTTGVILASLSSYFIGQWFGIKFFRKLFSRKLSKLYSFLSKSHWTEVAVARMVPVAPFSVVGLVAGALEIPLKQFLIGSLVGNLPGIILFIIFEKSLIEFILEPSWGSGALILALVAVLGFAIYKIKKRFVYES